jgi:hypothetical protein
MLREKPPTGISIFHIKNILCEQLAKASISEILKGASFFHNPFKAYLVSFLYEVLVEVSKKA